MTTEVDNFAKMFEESQAPVTKAVKNQFSVKEQEKEKKEDFSKTLDKLVVKNAKSNRGSTSRK